MNNHPHKTSWTEERVAILRKAVADGLSSGQAARKIGCTRNAANTKAVRLGLSFGGTDGPAAKSKNQHTASVAADLKVRPSPRNPVGNFRTSPPRPPVERDEPPGACTLTTLVEHSCRWPIGQGEAMTFCGKDAGRRSSYCGLHQPLSVQPFTGTGGSAFAPDLAHALRRII
jgi:hypothetical protein